MNKKVVPEKNEYKFIVVDPEGEKRSQLVYANTYNEAKEGMEQVRKDLKPGFSFYPDLDGQDTEEVKESYTPMYVSKETYRRLPKIVKILVSVAYTVVISWLSKLLIIYVSEGIFDYGADRFFDSTLFTIVCCIIGSLVGLHVYRSDDMFTIREVDD